MQVCISLSITNQHFQAVVTVVGSYSAQLSSSRILSLLLLFIIFYNDFPEFPTIIHLHLQGISQLFTSSTTVSGNTSGSAGRLYQFWIKPHRDVDKVQGWRTIRQGLVFGRASKIYDPKICMAEEKNMAET